MGSANNFRKLAILWLAAVSGCNGSISGPAHDANGGVSGGDPATSENRMQPNAGHSGAAGATRAGTGGSAGRVSSAGAGGAAGAKANPDNAGKLANPAPGSSLFMGVNFWNIEWEGSDNYFSSGVSWSKADNPWNPQLLKDIEPYHVLRFMDWNLINEADNPQADWSTRRQATDMQDEPVAFEWQIDLCNRSLKDYWVNIPHAANADYVTKLANLIHDKLDPQLRVYVEWSNEVWNGSFPQREYAQTQGDKLGLSGDDKAAAYQVYQSVRVFEAFAAAFGADSPRVVKVLAGQAAWTGPCEAQLKALADSNINPKKTQPTAYAVAPYFAGESIDELTHKGIAEAAGWIEDSAKCADKAGLPLIAYEGGQDSYSLGESGCSELQRDAGMRAVYTQFLDAMLKANLKGPLMHYTHTGNCWGLKRKTRDSAADAPKYQGMMDWIGKHP